MGNSISDTKKIANSSSSSSSSSESDGGVTVQDIEAAIPMAPEHASDEEAVENKQQVNTVATTANSINDPQRSPAAPCHTVPQTYVATKNPKETLHAVYKAGVYKASLTLDLLCVQSFMAGIYIAMASQLYLSIGGGVLGAIFFPTGLIAVVLTSGELFTGDALVFVASVLGGKVSVKSLLRNWTVAWTMNFVGCLAWAFVLAYASDALEDVEQKDFAIAVALKKAYQPWWNIFFKGIGANFMVCVGIWQATCAEETAGKVLALFPPIAGFVIMGFDHAIANQFLIPVGMMYGADISVYHLVFKALIPATLGNIVGGGVFVGGVYWYVFDSMTSSIQLFSRIRHGWQRRPTISSWHRGPNRDDLGKEGDDGHIMIMDEEVK